jgi:hypothetical protein
VTPVDPIAALEIWVDLFPSQTVAAKRLGVSPAFVSQMLNGRCGIPAWLLDALGLTTVVVAKAGEGSHGQWAGTVAPTAQTPSCGR